MKYVFPKVCFVLFFIVSWTACSYAEEWVPATNLKANWVVAGGGDGYGTATIEGAAVHLTADSTIDGDFYEALYKTETTGIAGIAATLSVDQVSANCSLGLKATIGQIGNKRIEVSIFLSQYDQLGAILGEKSVQYNIKMYDMDTGQSDLACAGTFGPWDGGWDPGESLFVGFVRIGSEFRFYTGGFKQLHIVQMLDGIVPLDGGVEVYAYASEGENVAIAGSISDILLFYP